MGMWRTGSHLAGSVCDALGKAKGHKLATCRGPQCSAVQRPWVQCRDQCRPREAFGSCLGTHHVSVSTRLRSVVDTLGSGLAYILHLGGCLVKPNNIRINISLKWPDSGPQRTNTEIKLMWLKMLSSMSLAQFWIYLCQAGPILEACLIIRPRSPPPHVVLMHSKWLPLSRKHVRSIAIWRSAPQSVVTIKASWGKEPLHINFTLFQHPWTPSECRTVLGDGCRELGFGFRCSLPEKWTLRAKRWTTHVLTWRLTPGTLQCRFHLNKRQHRHQ